ncbi:cyclic nucleotide-gated channel beta-1-like [Artemia franciscana]|uniref:Uncharacterized protein n=1 Tax=Artemia franciscana TaxID=6661 RepID=A0AA88I418_ARTSF|nr:hypothetical protein QYM36_005044 [Artemia franciscana]KAK2719419.1 hypothetical protein QYM36_005044 [Artemia franciscana]KAK2719420.1 hypothetical protein QYM36_005044 [Artemia franciscana]KAK2719421.1 hypothetical protein QYM36_005044 [Artemia franciscana]
MGSVSYQVMPSSGNSAGKRMLNGMIFRLFPLLFLVGSVAFLVFADPLNLFSKEAQVVTISPVTLLEEQLTNSIENMRNQFQSDLASKVAPIKDGISVLEQKLVEKIAQSIDEAEKRIVENTKDSEEIKKLVQDEVKNQLTDLVKTVDQIKEQLKKIEEKLINYSPTETGGKDEDEKAKEEEAEKIEEEEQERTAEEEKQEGDAAQ